MHALVDNLADLTALRDMESLDAALLATINDVLLPQTAAICRPAGYPSDMRWRTCAQLIAGVSVTSGEWTPSVGEALPLLEEFPLRQAALQDAAFHACACAAAASGRRPRRSRLASVRRMTYSPG